MNDSETRKTESTGMSPILLSATIGGAILLLTIVLVALILARENDDSTDVDVAENGPVELGRAVYNRDCFGCHTTDGSGSVGPSFEGLYGSEVTMDDGSTVVIDEDHIRQAIVDPRATTRDGFPDVMPPFDMLEDEEIEGLVTFIRSLR